MQMPEESNKSYWLNVAQAANAPKSSLCTGGGECSNGAIDTIFHTDHQPHRRSTPKESIRLQKSPWPSVPRVRHFSEYLPTN